MLLFRYPETPTRGRKIAIHINFNCKFNPKLPNNTQETSKIILRSCLFF